MKSIIACMFLVAICLFLKVQGDCQFHDQSLKVGSHSINCSMYTCHEDGHVTGLTCAVYQCAPGQQIGYKETDYSKPYPECCGGPICKT